MASLNKQDANANYRLDNIDEQGERKFSGKITLIIWQNIGRETKNEFRNNLCIMQYEGNKCSGKNSS